MTEKANTTDKHPILEKKLKNHSFSLKWGLIALVIACWVLPVLLIIGILGKYTFNRLEAQIADTITTSMENAVALSQNRIESAINASRTASSDTAIRDAYKTFQNDADQIALYSAVTSYLVGKYRYDDNFVTTFLYFCDDPETLFYANNRSSSGSFTGVREYRANMHETVQKTAPVIGTEIHFLGSQDGIYMIRNMVDSNFRPFAVIIMELNLDGLFDSLGSVVWLDNAAVYFETMPFVIIGENVPLPEEIFISGKAIYEKENNTYRVYERQRIEGQTISYAVETDSTLLMSEIPTFRKIILLLVFFAVPLLLFVVWIFYKFVSKPAQALMEASREIESGKIGYQVESIPRSQEFRYLTDGFNRMSKEVKVLFERSYMEQIALQNARINALQSQINPHFLNNTLEIINWEARLSGNEKVSRMIDSLSTMLGAATARGGSPLVKLSEELSYVDAYLYIISVRYGKRLTVIKEIDKTLMEQEVPRLVMQPIVENAVEHGISDRQNGELVLRVYQQEEDVVLEVENNGELSKSDKEAIDRLLSWDGQSEQKITPGRVGIRNVNLRLKILYGEGCGLTITSLENGKTLARIVLSRDGIAKNSIIMPV
ncbi:MAG: sensor histidine kinase [Flexilinea sp.]